MVFVCFGSVCNVFDDCFEIVIGDVCVLLVGGVLSLLWVVFDLVVINFLYCFVEGGVVFLDFEWVCVMYELMLIFDDWFDCVVCWLCFGGWFVVVYFVWWLVLLLVGCGLW